MSQLRKILQIPKKEVEEYNRLMQASQVDYGKEGIPRYATVASWTVEFDDGHEMDIMVCSDEPNYPLWCQAVLYHGSGEAGCTDPMDDLLGEFDIEGDNVTTYIVEVQAA